MILKQPILYCFCGYNPKKDRLEAAFIEIICFLYVA